jgi:hypothetical protein
VAPLYVSSASEYLRLHPRSVLAPLLTGRALQLTQVRQRIPQQFSPKWPQQVEFRYGCGGWSQRRCPLAPAPSTRKKQRDIWPYGSIAAFYALRRKGAGFRHRVFCLPKAPKRQINIRHSLADGRPDKQISSWTHSLSATLRCWALSRFDGGENITDVTGSGAVRKERNCL